MSRNDEETIRIPPALLSDAMRVTGKRSMQAVILYALENLVAPPQSPADALKRLQRQSVRNGNSRLTLRQVNAEIAAARRDRAGGS